MQTEIGLDEIIECCHKICRDGEKTTKNYKSILNYYRITLSGAMLLLSWGTANNKCKVIIQVKTLSFNSALSVLQTKTGTFANGTDPDEMAHNETRFRIPF